MTDPQPSLPSSRFRVSDLGRVPCLLSLVRLPLAVLFALWVQEPWWAFGALVLSALSDMLDGYFARRLNQVTETGMALDGATDKVFALTAAASMLWTGKLSWLALALLSVRELFEIPLVVWLLVSEQARLARMEQPMAKPAGKLATGLQFVVVSAALFGLPQVEWLALLPGLVGAVAAVGYFRDVLSSVRRGETGHGPSLYRRSKGQDS